MSRQITTIFTIIAFLLSIINCGKQNEYPTNPDSDSGTTDNEGIVELNLGSYAVHIEIQDEHEQPLGNIQVNGYLLTEYLFIFVADPDGYYYPALQIIPYDDIQPSGGLSSSQAGFASIEETEAISVVLVFTLIGVGLAVYEFVTDPPHFEVVRTDPWTTEYCVDGDLNDLFAIVGLCAIAGGVVIHVSSTVAQTTGSSAQTASFVLGQIADYATFTSLMGFVFHMFDEDILHICYVEYSDGRLPIVYIDEITLQRDFWIQFTLTWGENPRDLDSHLWTPSIGGSTYHVWYAEMGSKDNPPYALLDVDDIDSWGPEHITIYQGYSGSYTYAVNHYIWPNDQGVISQSGAQVKIFKENGDVQIVDVPGDYSEPGWWWHVCEIDGSSGSIEIINQISSDPPVSSKIVPQFNKTKILIKK